jgi:conjugal transfer/entry exclusion protein
LFRVSANSIGKIDQRLQKYFESFENVASKLDQKKSFKRFENTDWKPKVSKIQTSSKNPC